MSDRGIKSTLFPTPFFSSFIGKARPGERFSGDLETRAASWTSWALNNAVEMSGFTDRSYPALVLDGRFYDPRGTGPSVKPHLEISQRVLGHADKEFPYRLALIGNGLAFPWWVISEVKATRRALFTSGGSIEEAVSVLGPAQAPLVTALESLMAVASPQWNVIEGLLVTRDDGLSGDATGDFSVDEVARYFPAGAALHLRVNYDGALASENKRWAARRVGVWQVSGISKGESFSFGVLTPRLTRNSLFHDSLFSPATESPASLLVRGLLLERLVREHLNDEVSIEVGEAKSTEVVVGPKLRTIVAQVGQNQPKASVESAVYFIQQYPAGEDAWEALTDLATRQGTILTTTKEGFLASYANAQRYVRRAEEPERDDLDVILPLGWDSKGRVVRFTFSRPSNDDE